MEELNNDIEKYLRGELTPAEMHALEQKALRDPFLADALEGAEHAGSENFSLDMLLLQKSIHEKSKKKKKARTISLNIPTLYMSVAAGLLILLASTYVIILSINHRQKTNQLALANQAMPDPGNINDSLTIVLPGQSQQLSMRRSPERTRGSRNRNYTFADSVSATGSTSGPIAQVEVQVVSGENGYYSQTDEVEVEAELSEAPVIVRNTDKKESATKQAQSAGAESKTAETPAKRSVADSKPTDSRRTKRKAAQYAETSPAADVMPAIAKTISGKVIDETGANIPGANVIVKGTTIGTVTDVEGNFEITLPPNGETLVFNFIGYLTTENKVSGAEPVNVVLKADVTSLSEVVVVGYGNSGGNNEPEPETFELAEPVGGRDEFQKYLDEQKKYPQQAIDQKAEGKVTIQFTVKPDGQLVDFKVVKGIGFGCEEEVIRLIKEGPQWNPSRKNRQPVEDKVKVRVKFSLSGK
jgi:TonB family protein